MPRNLPVNLRAFLRSDHHYPSNKGILPPFLISRLLECNGEEGGLEGLANFRATRFNADED